MPGLLPSCEQRFHVEESLLGTLHWCQLKYAWIDQREKQLFWITLLVNASSIPFSGPRARILMLNNFNCPETTDTQWLKMMHGENSNRHPNRIVNLNRCRGKFVFNLSHIYSICCDVSLRIHFACLFCCLGIPIWTPNYALYSDVYPKSRRKKKKNLKSSNKDPTLHIFLSYLCSSASS